MPFMLSELRTVRSVARALAIATCLVPHTNAHTDCRVRPQWEAQRQSKRSMAQEPDHAERRSYQIAPSRAW